MLSKIRLFRASAPLRRGVPIEAEYTLQIVESAPVIYDRGRTARATLVAPHRGHSAAPAVWPVGRRRVAPQIAPVLSLIEPTFGLLVFVFANAPKLRPESARFIPRSGVWMKRSKTDDRCDFRAESPTLASLGHKSRPPAPDRRRTARPFALTRGT
jgi:hypothetical protein